MIGVEEMRAKYPEPVETTVDAYLTENRCVGGILCAALVGDGANHLRFPEVEQIASALRAANPRLVHLTALDIAEHIADENDEGNFESAWAWLDKGLSA